MPITIDNYSETIKKLGNDNNMEWWLRSAMHSNSLAFYRVDTRGEGNMGFHVVDSAGVSPAFRIG